MAVTNRHQMMLEARALDAKDIRAVISMAEEFGAGSELMRSVDLVNENQKTVLAAKIASQPGADIEADRIAAVAKIGENIQIRRFVRFQVGS